jgi:hypothetical protein
MDLGTAVAASWLVFVGGVLLLGALFPLTRRAIRFGTFRVQVREDVFLGVGLVLVPPAGLVAGFGHYILDANTGVYGTPGDFRNSAAFVNTCWFFVVVVAPAVALLGLALLASAAFRGWRAHRHPEAPPRGKS